MKTVIFAGGLGSRISEESHLKPKPMIEIGGRPMLWHIMKIYQKYGFNEFIVCLGYKGYIIKEYFMNYFLHNSDVTINLANQEMEIHKSPKEDIKVTLVDTGLDTQTAGRLKLVQQYIGQNEDFMLTYGDGVTDLNIDELVEYHKNHGKLATVTAVQPPGRFGAIATQEDGSVSKFIEKPTEGAEWINGGFFVLSSKIFNYLEGDMKNVPWEQQPMKGLQKDNQLVAFKHRGFWKCMDTLRDKNELEKLWISQKPWKVWS
ncbi:glucose-1-phosphate cytidylyltransferase [Fulvivirga kasyanovii]|uniref:Glucose-1-phosphate cytidylyltransferase n=1 Tax=Fulvivirga kasyanovii TaxID=396812 RepID=A0ABW9RMB6_9BACT|nr:glucose-1-phosphate cytidylyltransferase [Fulvivirga kasyanovii]MTI25268.1 glucose-1-phosphate cytidylyltransferase [Fulvivirga kasyanovii]